MGTRIEDSDTMRRAEEQNAGCASCKENFLAGKNICPVCGADFTQVEEANFDDD